MVKKMVLFEIFSKELNIAGSMCCKYVFDTYARLKKQVSQ